MPGPLLGAVLLVSQGIGAKLLVDPDREAVGTLCHPELDRVVARDALAELELGALNLREPNGMWPAFTTAAVSR